MVGKRLILVDTREKVTAKVKPLTFPNIPSKPATLETGDYTLWGYKALMVVEHKRWGDLIGCISTSSRWAKFRKGQLTRLSGFEYKAILVTGNIDNPITYSNCKLATVCERVSHIVAHYNIPVLFAANRTIGAKLCESLLLEWAKEIEKG